MKITLAYATKINGRTRKADSTIEVDRDTADVLISRGLARKADKAVEAVEADEVDPEPAGNEEPEQDNSLNERNDLNG